MTLEEELLDACEKNKIAKAKALLQSGADPNVKLSEGFTPLMLCVGNGHYEIARLLLDNKADPNRKNDGGSAALKMAVLKENSLLCRDLLESGAQVNEYDAKGFTPLMYASMIGHQEIIDLLIKHGASQTALSREGGLTAHEFSVRAGNQSAPTPAEDGAQTTQEEVSEKPPEFTLDDLVGQTAAKDSLRQVIAMTKVNREREKRGLKTPQVTLHAVFSGNPGTGKTTFARCYADEVKKIGFLRTGQLIEVSRNDLIAEYSGQTAKKTTELVTKALGGILFIDEAYSLKTGKDDLFGQEAIDTLIKLIEDHRKDLIVILAGYTNEMRDFLHLNPGLKSRIPNFIEFHDYNEEDLGKIFDIVIKKYGVSADESSKKYVLEELNKERKSRSFGNGRSVRNLIERALTQQSVRLEKSDISQLSDEDLSRLIVSDFTKDASDDSTHSEASESLKQEKPVSAREKLGKLVGLDLIKKEIDELSEYISISKLRSGSAPDKLTLHMVFSGNSGTGKSTVARLLAKNFQEIGVLGEGHLIEAERSQLVAPYVGQTAIKTKELIERSLGGVLFIDEAYSLNKGPQDHFGQEAIETLMKYMEDYRDRFILILAGYPVEMSRFLDSNPGLRSRFYKELVFEDYSDSELLDIFSFFIREKGFHLGNGVQTKIQYFLAEQKQSESNFANARAIRNILERAYRKQASRLSKMGTSNISNDELHTLESVDFE